MRRRIAPFDLVARKDSQAGPARPNKTLGLPAELDHIGYHPRRSAAKRDPDSTSSRPSSRAVLRIVDTDLDEYGASFEPQIGHWTKARLVSVPEGVGSRIKKMGLNKAIQPTSIDTQNDKGQAEDIVSPAPSIMTLRPGTSCAVPHVEEFNSRIEPSSSRPGFHALARLSSRFMSKFKRFAHKTDKVCWKFPCICLECSASLSSVLTT